MVEDNWVAAAKSSTADKDSLFGTKHEVFWATVSASISGNEVKRDLSTNRGRDRVTTVVLDIARAFRVVNKIVAPGEA